MANVRISSGLVRQMLGDGVTTTGAGDPVYKDSPNSTFQAILTTTAGTGSATVKIEGSNDGVHWATTALGTITMTTVASGSSDGFSIDAPWKYVRANVTTLTGTGAVLTCSIGV